MRLGWPPLCESPSLAARQLTRIPVASPESTFFGPLLAVLQGFQLMLLYFYLITTHLSHATPLRSAV